MIAGCRRAVADVGVANQALGHAFGIQPGQLREGASDQQLRYAHAKAASDEFQAEHQAGAVQLGPKRRQALLDLIDQAEAEGGIRQDVALDLRQVVRNTAGVSGVDNVRRKIADREREGLLSAQMAERLRAAAQVLAEALARV